MEIHSRIIKKSRENHGIISQGSIYLCAEAPKRVIYGFEPYKALHQKAASLIFEINKLHPFVEGNKRTAWEASDVFLRMNNHRLAAEKCEAVDVSLQIADCSMNIEEAVLWMKNHVKRLKE